MRTCGCPEDYHLADCPIFTSRSSYDSEDVDDFYDRDNFEGEDDDEDDEEDRY